MTLSREDRLRRAFEKPSSLSPAGHMSEAPDPVDLDLLADLRAPFVQWFDSHVRLDAKAVALRTPPVWFTSVATLHADFCGWMADRDLAPPTSSQFRDLLSELGCQFRRIGEQEFLANVALREDMEAHERFQNPPPPPAPAKRHVAKLWRVK
jgi:hypothetical protein